MKKTCSHKQEHLLQWIDATVPLLVDEKHKLLTCYTLKAGATNWKTMLLNMTFKGHFHGYQVGDIHMWDRFHGQGFYFLETYSPNNRQEFLQTFKKLMIVRHPLARLVSLYREKLKHCDWTPVGRNYYCRGIGTKVISKYQPNATLWSRTLGYPVSFEDFVKYIVNIDLSEYDKHFYPMYEKCKPCVVNYDYIIKVETIYDDIAFLRQAVYNNSPQAQMPPAYNHNNSNQLLDSYFQRISPDILERLFRVYQNDFETLGYSFNYPRLFHSNDTSKTVG